MLYSSSTKEGKMKDKKYYVTEEGYEALKEKLSYLINVKRKNNIIALQEARALGDLSENADYHAAREEQSIIETEIAMIEANLDKAVIIKKKNDGTVGIGSTVKIKYMDDDEDEEDELTIVGVEEADPKDSKISNESPIAKALLDHKVGDVVDVASPNGVYQIKIKGII